MAFTKCEYAKSQIDEAGRNLVSLPPNDPARDTALEIINNWRSCHSYPLHIVTKNLKDRSSGMSKTPLVVRRIKRLQSISLKLKHNEGMRLSQMQDIGGCRSVLKTVIDAEQLTGLYQAASVKHSNRADRSYLMRLTNYIDEPKADGYRGIHLIMKYQSTTSSKKAYNGQRIEIQIRSQLQHAWATAVETCQAFTGQALKSKIKTATDEWLRFFALMSAAIAAREKRALVPGTPDTKEARKKELKQIAEDFQIIPMLTGWNVAMQHDKIADDHQSAAFLLELDTHAKMLRIMPYKQVEMPAAHAMYLLREKTTENDLHVQVVLVSADSVANLKRAYPNFYVDTNDFIDAVKDEIY